MFGVDFSELMVILVVALIVIGPERLPKVARTLGHLWGRAQRYVNGVKADIARDMAIEEFRQLQQKVQQDADNAQRSLSQATRAVEQQVRQVNRAVEQPLQTAVQAAANAVHSIPVAAQPSVVQQQLELDAPQQDPASAKQ